MGISCPHAAPIVLAGSRLPTPARLALPAAVAAVPFRVRVPNVGRVTLRSVGRQVSATLAAVVLTTAVIGVALSAPVLSHHWPLCPQGSRIVGKFILGSSDRCRHTHRSIAPPRCPETCPCLRTTNIARDDFESRPAGWRGIRDRDTRRPVAQSYRAARGTHRRSMSGTCPATLGVSRCVVFRFWISDIFPPSSGKSCGQRSLVASLPSPRQTARQGRTCGQDLNHGRAPRRS